MQPKQRTWIKGMASGVLPIAGLIAILVALIVLQLHWSQRVSEAERDRLQQNLQRSTSGFQATFARNLLEICQTLQASQPRGPRIVLDNLFDRYAAWSRVSGHAALIGNLYIWPQPTRQSNVLFRLDPQTRSLDPVPWPAPLRAFAPPGMTNLNNLPRYRKGWLWDERIPVLIHPVYALAEEGTTGPPHFYGYLFAVFNPQDFARVYLPELGRRYFPLSNGFVFQIVEQGTHGPRVVYQSDGQTAAGVFEHADALIPLLDGSTLYRSGESRASAGSPAAGVHLSALDTAQWQIAIRHRSGSVDAAVVSLRHRDLAVSMVLLAMLLVSLITILVATRRARRLARLQMEFASGVSHELRTPLAVISSAAENLADGVVTEGDRIRDYGALIHEESRRLSGMVDHILDFARLHSEAHSFRLGTAAVADIVKGVVANERPLIESSGVVVEVNVPEGLPSLLTDPTVLGQCLQNLLSNALKYGNSGGRILLNATRALEDGQDRVLITVQDFGVGIAPEELSHIYEPFYRAGGARDSQIHGTGLGLSLTRKMIEGLGGRITVESSPGKGSVFTLHVPVASDKSRHAPASGESRSR